MGAGSRAGWYSYDWVDNARQPSATRIIRELQHPEIGTIFPWVPVCIQNTRKRILVSRCLRRCDETVARAL
jgi:hypothetical protein